MSNPMSERIKEYIQGRADTRLEKWDKEFAKEQLDAPERAAELAALRGAELAKFAVRAWLSAAATRAWQISFATHPPKFTHSDAKGSSVFLTDFLPDLAYLSSAALLSPSSDVVGNAAVLDVAGLLQLDVDGSSLAQQIAKGDLSALQPFAEHESQLAEWQQGFLQALASKELRSHALAKQLYFPIENNEYHLLSPLFASSLTQDLYQRITESRFSDAAKALRQLKREQKFAEQVTVDYLNVAVQIFGGTKPQNISLLNSGRRGQAYLLCASPPKWQNQLTPPIAVKNAFWRELNQRTWRLTRDLKQYLIKIIDLDSTLARREKRAAWVDEIIDILLQYAAEIQQMQTLAGWSADSKLPRAEQLWLDPLRAQFDAEFKLERERKDWQDEIAASFARWLNVQLDDKKLTMGDVEAKEWQAELSKKLARLNDDLRLQQELAA